MLNTLDQVAAKGAETVSTQSNPRPPKPDEAARKAKPTKVMHHRKRKMAIRPTTPFQRMTKNLQRLRPVNPAVRAV